MHDVMTATSRRKYPCGRFDGAVMAGRVGWCKRSYDVLRAVDGDVVMISLVINTFQTTVIHNMVP